MSIERDMYDEMLDILGGEDAYRAKELAEDKLELLAKWLVRKFMLETDGGWDIDKPNATRE